MDAVFKKLNYKGHPQVFALNAPGSFKPSMESIEGGAVVATSLDGATELEFLIAFVTKKAEVDSLAVAFAPLLKGDAVVWMCYPKGSSKKYKCDFNRDNGWDAFGKQGLEPIRMVAIDEDWSALRFRKADYIKTMTRKFAISEKGKEKSAHGKG